MQTIYHCLTAVPRQWHKKLSGSTLTTSRRPGTQCQHTGSRHVGSDPVHVVAVFCEKIPIWVVIPNIAVIFTFLRVMSSDSQRLMIRSETFISGEFFPAGSTVGVPHREPESISRVK